MRNNITIKKLFILGIAIMLTISLCACNGGSEKTPPVSDTSSEAVSETANEKAEDSYETENKADESTNTVEVKFNTELLSDFGLTYTQLKEKYGELVEVGTVGGGYFYAFKNGFGRYAWSNEDIHWEGNIPTDENGKIISETAMLPDDKTKCSTIEAKTKDLFWGIATPISASETASKYGLEYLKFEDNTIDSGEDGYEGWQYTSLFMYEGIRIVIYTHEKEKIDSDSRIVLFPKEKV